ncbi:hypothetical protein SLE2022_360250 [Rubroshorea leprosula]
MEIRLDWLLRAAWVAGTLPILIASLPFSLVNSFHGFLLEFSSRGKTQQSSSHKFTVPQRFFLHFYVVGVVWTTFLMLATWCYAYKMAPLGVAALSFSVAASHLTDSSHVFSLHKSRVADAQDRFEVWKSAFLLFLMEIHVLRRLYETLYVFKYSSSARMHIFGYLTGLYFYVAAPLSLCSFCAFEVLNFAADQVAEFNVKGPEMLSVTEVDLWRYAMPVANLGWWQWVGAAIFAWGWIHQCRCHAILGSIREHRDQSDKYVIPSGDWFDMVSSPHYLAEMVIYAGLLIASGGTDFTIWLLLAFVVANLAFAAAETQRWYLKKFEDYPHNRRILLPVLY